MQHKKQTIKSDIHLCDQISLFFSALFETTSLISPLFTFLSSLLHTDSGKQTFGKSFCLAGPAETGRRGGLMKNQARSPGLSLCTLCQSVCQPLQSRSLANVLYTAEKS